MVVVVQAVRIYEVRILKPEFCGEVVHQNGKIPHVPRSYNGKRHGCVVSGAKHQTAEQIPHGKLFALRKINAAALRPDRHFRHGDHPVQIFGMLDNGYRRNDFSGRSVGKPQVFVSCKKHPQRRLFQNYFRARTACHCRLFGNYPSKTESKRDYERYFNKLNAFFNKFAHLSSVTLSSIFKNEVRQAFTLTKPIGVIVAPAPMPPA